MKAGTLVRFFDGRIATVCYNQLDGVGVCLGDKRDEVLAATKAESNGWGENDLFPVPTIMLRERYPHPPSTITEFIVGYEIVEVTP